jgi:hypothetical protein
VRRSYGAHMLKVVAVARVGTTTIRVVSAARAVRLKA